MNNKQTWWHAVETRDTRHDGEFVYGVTTTGIYCKPSCKTRRPLQKNVRFFASPQVAETNGFRACKKCRPDTVKKPAMIETVVHGLCRYIENNAEKTLPLATIAKKAGYSAAHIQKAFTATIGHSPKAYQSAIRRRKLKRELKTSNAVPDAIYSAGYGSSSRVYEQSARGIGMTPKQYSKGGAATAIHYAAAKTSLGMTMIGATARGICFLQFGKNEPSLLAELRGEFPKADVQPMPTSARQQFTAWMEALNDYLDKKQSLQDLPLDIRGTAFQLLVWRFLQTIPAGEIRSYTEVAKAIGKAKAIRAVATACASNRIAIAIPCHRVLRGDGSLAGYRWGLDRKRALLANEKRS